jgi:uncharacterized protein with HEPN domain
LRGDSARLEDMLAAIAAIRRHTQGGRAAYDRDELVRVWVLHHLQIIGEAAARLNPAGQAAERLPTTSIVGMRNVLVHGYFQIDDELVWNVVEQELAPLEREVRNLLRKLPNKFRAFSRAEGSGMPAMRRTAHPLHRQRTEGAQRRGAASPVTCPTHRVSA